MVVRSAVLMPRMAVRRFLFRILYNVISKTLKISEMFTRETERSDALSVGMISSNIQIGRTSLNV